MKPIIFNMRNDTIFNMRYEIFNIKLIISLYHDYEYCGAVGVRIVKIRKALKERANRRNTK
eukprot:scaffold114543_cov52-Attheya_sp.AAC.1